MFAWPLKANIRSQRSCEQAGTLVRIAAKFAELSPLSVGN